MRARSELLVPAGSLRKLRIAVLYGADAVYLGTPDMSLRTKSEFTLEEIIEGVEYAHAHGVKVYLTLNMFSHNKDIDKLPLFVETIQKVKPDGVIIADPGVFQFVRENAPELPLHVSTQANVCSWLSVKFWENLGAKLCVLGREVSYSELVEIREKCPDIELETFVHGSMCMAYSGRCLISNFMSERGANQGNCAYNCRWNYKVHLKLRDGALHELEINDSNRELVEFMVAEENRPQDFMELHEDERGSYLMNPKDLCLMPRLDQLLALGINSLKVEGRNKSEYYLAVVTRTYRQAIDDWYANPTEWSYEKYVPELYTVPNRGYTLAFHDGRLHNLAHNYENTENLSAWEFAGAIKEVHEDHVIMEVKNRLQEGDVLEFLTTKSMDGILLRMYEYICPKTGEVTNAVHGGGRDIKIPFSLFNLENGSVGHRFQVGELVRKAKILDHNHQARIENDMTSFSVEANHEDPSTASSRPVLRIASQKRPSRLGAKGCCGRGCNGCLIFAHSPIFERARTVMQEKKIGEMLDKDFRKAEGYTADTLPEDISTDISIDAK